MRSETCLSVRKGSFYSNGVFQSNGVKRLSVRKTLEISVRQSSKLTSSICQSLRQPLDDDQTIAELPTECSVLPKTHRAKAEPMLPLPVFHLKQPVRARV